MPKYMMRLAGGESEPESQIIEARRFDADRQGNLTFYGESGELVGFASAAWRPYVIQMPDESPPEGTTPARPRARTRKKSR